MAEEQISAEIILYQAGGTNVPVEVRYQDETMWMPQAQIAELFGTTKQNVSYHLSNIFHEGELSKDSVVKEFLTTAADGKSYRVQFYDLDAIIAVGYRVNSIRATKFRQWATATLRDLPRGASRTPPAVCATTTWHERYSPMRGTRACASGTT